MRTPTGRFTGTRGSRSGFRHGRTFVERRPGSGAECEGVHEFHSQVRVSYPQPGKGAPDRSCWGPGESPWVSGNRLPWWRSRAKLAETWGSRCWDLFIGSETPISGESFELVTVEVRKCPGLDSRHQWRRGVSCAGAGLRLEHGQVVGVGLEFRSSGTEPVGSVGGYGSHAVRRCRGHSSGLVWPTADPFACHLATRGLSLILTSARLVFHRVTPEAGQIIAVCDARLELPRRSVRQCRCNPRTVRRGAGGTGGWWRPDGSGGIGAGRRVVGDGRYRERSFHLRSRGLRLHRRGRSV